MNITESGKITKTKNIQLIIIIVVIITTITIKKNYTTEHGLSNEIWNREKWRNLRMRRKMSRVSNGNGALPGVLILACQITPIVSVIIVRSGGVWLVEWSVLRSWWRITVSFGRVIGILNLRRNERLSQMKWDKNYSIGIWCSHLRWISPLGMRFTIIGFIVSRIILAIIRRQRTPNYNWCFILCTSNIHSFSVWIDYIETDINSKVMSLFHKRRYCKLKTNQK